MSDTILHGDSNSPHYKDVTMVRNGRNINFSIPYQVTESQALVLQKECGYHPAGYGFYKFKANTGNSHWVSSVSCD